MHKKRERGLLTHKKVLNLKPTKKIPFNVERTSKMEISKKLIRSCKAQ